MKQQPLISIVIPVFNGEKFIQSAIDSVLEQTYKNIEIIIVDDGSTDGTIDILEKYPSSTNLRILHHEAQANRGVSISRKLGLTFAKGEYLSLLDADDQFLPDKIEKQIIALQNDDSCVLCHSDVEYLYEVKSDRCRQRQFRLSENVYKYKYSKEPYFMTNNHICNSTVVVNTSILRKISFEIPQLFQYEDWLLWILLADTGKFIYLPQKLVLYRYHEDCATAKIDQKPLSGLYSKLELYLSVSARANNRQHVIRAEELKNVTLAELRQFYSGGISK